ncbi:MAG: helix-turn-helix domain-containing protein [Nitrospirae bacterium]|nr:helix-turn-helix domain-containing protein [Fimbriimonadaceae bacterium]
MKSFYTVLEAAGELNIGRSLLYRLIASGQIETVHIGRKTLVPRESLEAFADSVRETGYADPDAVGFHEGGRHRG